jgi:ribonuclease D
MSFFVSPFGEKTVCDELNAFLKSHRIVNVEKRLIDGDRGTGWVFLVEYGAENKNQVPVSTSPKVDYRDILNEQEYALFDKLRQLRKELAEKQGIPVYAIFTKDHLANMIKNKYDSPKGLASPREGLRAFFIISYLLPMTLTCYSRGAAENRRFGSEGGRAKM